MKFDEIIDRIGNFGTYQKLIVFLILLSSIPATFHQLGQVFFAANVDYWCTTSEFKSLNCPHSWNLTKAECEDTKRSFLAPSGESCFRVANVTVGQFLDGYQPTAKWPTAQCDNWVYDTSQYKSTIIQEWNLVCDSSTKPAISMSIFFTGVLLGSFVAGVMSDRFGRKRVFFGSVVLQSAFGFAASFSSSFLMYTCLRFIVAAANIGVFMISVILAIEWVGPLQRRYVMVYAGTMWAIGQMVLAGMAYLIPRWRILLRVSSFCCLIIFGLFPFTPESVRWLMMKGRISEANEAIKKAARINSVQLPRQLLDETDLEKPQSKEPRKNAIDLFRTPNMRRKTLTMLFAWFVISCTYYGLSISTSSLGVNDYLAFFISGSVEILSKVLMLIILDRIGRRHCVCWAMVVGGLGCIVTVWTPEGVWTITTAMIGKFGSSFAFSSIYVYAAEIYPTPVRSTGIGLSSCSARIGSIFSPMILELKHIWSPLPYLIFGSLCVIGGLIILTLPETSKHKLPETMEDGEIFGRKSGNLQIMSHEKEPQSGTADDDA